MTTTHHEPRWEQRHGVKTDVAKLESASRAALATELIYIRHSKTRIWNREAKVKVIQDELDRRASQTVYLFDDLFEGLE